MNSTVDGFEGTASEYILYLERTIVSLRERHSSCAACAPCRCASQSCPPPESGKELEFVRFDPTAEVAGRKLGERKKSKRVIPRWKEHALTLVRETPNANAWNERLKDKGIFDAMRNGTAVSTLLLLDVDNRRFTSVEESSSMGQIIHSNPISRIENYARISVQREISASMATALANYQKFLVLSACAVLVGRGSPTKDVYNIVRICMGNNVTDVHCQRILRGCKFLHELMDNLYMGGWGLRAYELLLICGFVILCNLCSWLIKKQGTRARASIALSLTHMPMASSY